MEEQKQAEQQWNKIRREQINILKEAPSEENLWQAVMAFQDYPFKTVTGLPFQYTLKTGKNGEWTKELWIDRREKSKSLSWSSVVLAFKNSRKTTEVVERPKALGDIRGISYIYPILWRLELIRVPDTQIDYPVLQREENDTYYLRHNSSGRYAFAGSIYTEEANSRDFKDPMTVLYGHNMRDGSMFQNLHFFEDETFLRNIRNFLFICRATG